MNTIEDKFAECQSRINEAIEIECSYLEKDLYELFQKKYVKVKFENGNTFSFIYGKARDFSVVYNCKGSLEASILMEEDNNCNNWHVIKDIECASESESNLIILKKELIDLIKSGDSNMITIDNIEYLLEIAVKI